nr:MAG TPA: hypothetical protein [Bacteriophage sp.]DAS53776.1 MAG TPA: hypothetical protein [Caudoviricetes sp.]
MNRIINRVTKNNYGKKQVYIRVECNERKGIGI